MPDPFDIWTPMQEAASRPGPEAIVAEALAPPDLPDEFDGAAPWRITGRNTAEWAVAKMREADERFAEAAAPAQDAIRALEAKVAELREFIDAEARKRDHTVGFFKGHLIDWGRRERAARIEAGEKPDRVRSFRLAGGLVKSTKARDRVDVVTAEHLVSWAVTEAPEVASLIPDVDHTALQRYIAATGLIPPGVEVTTATEDERTWDVKLS
jgi:hypothetical protein